MKISEKPSETEKTRMTTGDWDSWAYAVADGVRVNESIVENRLTERGRQVPHEMAYYSAGTAEGGGRRMVPRVICYILNLCCTFFPSAKVALVLFGVEIQGIY